MTTSTDVASVGATSSSPVAPTSGLGHGIAARVAPRLGLGGRVGRRRSIGIVARSSAGFGLSIGRAASARPHIERHRTGDHGAIRPPFVHWPFHDDPVEPAGASAVRRSPAPAATGPARTTQPSSPAANRTDDVAEFGDRKVDALRRLLRGGRGAPATSATSPGTGSSTVDAPVDAPVDATASAPARDAHGSSQAPTPRSSPAPDARPDVARSVAPRSVGRQRGDTAAGPATGPGQFGRRLRPETVAASDRAPIPTAPSGPPTAPSPTTGPRAGEPTRDAPVARRTATQPRRSAADQVAALRRMVESRQASAGSPTEPGSTNSSGRPASPSSPSSPPSPAAQAPRANDDRATPDAVDDGSVDDAPPVAGRIDHRTLAAVRAGWPEAGSPTGVPTVSVPPAPVPAGRTPTGPDRVARVAAVPDARPTTVARASLPTLDPSPAAAAGVDTSVTSVSPVGLTTTAGLALAVEPAARPGTRSSNELRRSRMLVRRQPVDDGFDRRTADPETDSDTDTGTGADHRVDVATLDPRPPALPHDRRSDHDANSTTTTAGPTLRTTRAGSIGPATPTGSGPSPDRSPAQRRTPRTSPAVHRTVERRDIARRSPMSDLATRVSLPHTASTHTRPATTLSASLGVVRPPVDAGPIGQRDVATTSPAAPVTTSSAPAHTLQSAAPAPRALIRPGTMFRDELRAAAPSAARRSHVSPGPGALRRAITPALEATSTGTDNSTGTDTPSTGSARSDAVAERFLTELSRGVRRSPDPLPAAFTPMAEAITGRRTVMISTDDASRRALRSVGKVAATTDDVIHLARSPRPDARTAEVMAHELTHVAHPSSAPRFFDDDHRGPEERRAEAVGRLMARSPLAPTAPGRRAGSTHTARTVHRSPATGPSSTGSMSADDLAAQITGSRSGTDSGRPTGDRGATVRRRVAVDPGELTSSVESSSQRSPTSYSAATLDGPDHDPGAILEGFLGSAEGRQWFRDQLRDNVEVVFRALEDHVVVELERRGGRSWSGL